MVMATDMKEIERIKKVDAVKNLKHMIHDGSCAIIIPHICISIYISISYQGVPERPGYFTSIRHKDNYVLPLSH